jgi:DNA-binding response OmpR family regulator
MKKILIIEDDKIIKNIIEFILKKEGYEVEFAFDGLVGLAKIKSYQPDMVITDVLLPYKSGLEIISFTKNLNPTTPIIVISSLGKEDITVVEAFKLGATDILAKPFNPIELKSKLKTYLAA